MNENRKNFERLTRALVDDIDRLSDIEVFQETKEDYRDVETVVAAAKASIEKGIIAAGKQRLQLARDGLRGVSTNMSFNVRSISSVVKKQLIDQFSNHDAQLKGRLTMAARNSSGGIDDIDSLLEDLYDLGLIDEEGNML